MKPGATSYAKRYIEDGNPVSSFKLLFDNSIMMSIQKYPKYQGQLTDSKFTVTVTDIKKFELQYWRGILVSKNTSMSDLWDKLYGSPIFCNTMSRNRFKSIMKYFRSYNICAKRQHRSKDKISVL